jgi:hypothetical protein
MAVRELFNHFLSSKKRLVEAGLRLRVSKAPATQPTYSSIVQGTAKRLPRPQPGISMMITRQNRFRKEISRRKSSPGSVG